MEVKMDNITKEYLEKQLMSIGDKFQKNQSDAKVLLKKRKVLQDSINTINLTLEDFVKNGSIIMAKSEAIRSMLEE